MPAHSAKVPFRIRNSLPVIAFFACALVYLVDMAVLKSVPEAGLAFAANFAVPFDLMVCAPLVFYFLFVRRRGITPIAVLPAIYAGGAISATVAVPDAPSLLPLLLACAFVVDIAVLVHEIPLLAQAFRKGYLARKEEFSQPIEWFLGGFGAIVPNRIAARAAATETTMWYWLTASWRQAPEPPKDSVVFTYHKECGFVALSCVIIVLGLVETTVVHIAVSQVSIHAAFALSFLSLYALAWISANARAAAKSPIVVREDSITAVWGAFLCMRIEGGAIERVVLSDPGLNKRETLDMSTLGGTPCWIVLRTPIEAETILGAKRRVKAVKLSPDRPREFARRANEIAADQERSAHAS